MKPFEVVMPTHSSFTVYYSGDNIEIEFWIGNLLFNELRVIGKDGKVIDRSISYE